MHKTACSVVDTEMQPPPGMPGAPPWQDHTATACEVRPTTPPRRLLKAIVRPRTPPRRVRLPSPRIPARYAHPSQGSRPRITTDQASAPQATKRTAPEEYPRSQKRHKSSDLNAPSHSNFTIRYNALLPVLQDMKTAKADRTDNSVDTLLRMVVDFVVLLAQEACHGVIKQTDGTVCEPDFEDTRRCSKTCFPYASGDKGCFLHSYWVSYMLSFITPPSSFHLTV